MPHRSVRAWFCLATAFLAVLAMLLSVVHVQSGHSAYAMAQTETQRHVELAAAIAEHGHAHDEGEPDERLPGHVHGHNTADHLHETASLVDTHQLGAPRFVRALIRHEQQDADPGLPDGLERPPRSDVA